MRWPVIMTDTYKNSDGYKAYLAVRSAIQQAVNSATAPDAITIEASRQTVASMFAIFEDAGLIHANEALAITRLCDFLIDNRRGFYKELVPHTIARVRWDDKGILVGPLHWDGKLTLIEMPINITPEPGFSSGSFSMERMRANWIAAHPGENPDTGWEGATEGMGH